MFFYSSNEWGSSSDDSSSGNDSSPKRFKPTRRPVPGKRGRKPTRQMTRVPKRGGRTKRKVSYDSDFSDSDDDDDVRRNSNRRSSQKVRYALLY